MFQQNFAFNGSQLAKMKKSIPDTCPCHEIYRDEALGLESDILEKLRYL